MPTVTGIDHATTAYLARVREHVDAIDTDDPRRVADAVQAFTVLDNALNELGGRVVRDHRVHDSFVLVQERALEVASDVQDVLGIEVAA